MALDTSSVSSISEFRFLCKSIEEDNLTNSELELVKVKLLPLFRGIESHGDLELLELSLDDIFRNIQCIKTFLGL